MAMQPQHQSLDISTSSRMECLQSGLTCNPSASKKRRLDKQYIPHLFNKQQQQCHGSIGTSTSGRTSAGQVERMRFEVEAVRKRQCTDLISVLKQQAVKMMKDKDAEIERASRRNTELEQKVSELAAERLIWFTAAKNSEALAFNLKSTLEQALQDAASTALFNECDAEDAASCCYHGTDGREELH